MNIIYFTVYTNSMIKQLIAASHAQFQFHLMNIAAETAPGRPGGEGNGGTSTFRVLWCFAETLSLFGKTPF